MTPEKKHTSSHLFSGNSRFKNPLPQGGPGGHKYHPHVEPGKKDIDGSFNKIKYIEESAVAMTRFNIFAQKMSLFAGIIRLFIFEVSHIICDIFTKVPR